MKRLVTGGLTLAMVGTLVGALPAAAETTPAKVTDPVSYVDPLIARPGVATPTPEPSAPSA